MTRQRDSRLRPLVACILVGIGLLWVRAFQLTVVRHEVLRSKALKQQTEFESIPSIRGPILDRAGRNLAFSVAGSALAVDPKDLSDVGKFADAMEAAGVMSRSSVLSAIAARPGKTFVWLTHKLIDEAVACSLETTFRPALIRLPETKRLYPLGIGAGPVLGATGREGNGLLGIEMLCQSYLRGVDGRMLVYRTGMEGPPGAGRVIVKPQQSGAAVETTINLFYQQIVDARLREVAEEQRAKGGTAILLDPNTCEILALAVYPGFDPDNIGGADSTSLTNWAVSHNYEPGSTYKFVTFASAIESGVIRPGDMIDCHNGSRAIPGGKPIKDHEPSGVIPAWEVMARSSNIGTGIIAERVGAEGFYDMERLFGFGSPTHVGLPGEERGWIPNPSLWSNRSLVTQAFGQEVSCTALQLAVAYAAVANGGFLLRPFIVRSIRGPDGTILKSYGREVVRQPISGKTAQILREMLRKVVTDGTGSKAEVEGLFPAGKTGTAQKFIPEEGSYSTKRYVASFCGFAPYDRPRWLCLVVLDEPRGTYWGGSVAAPAFARIIEDIAKLDSQSRGDRIPGDERVDGTFVPWVVGLTPGLACKIAREAGLSPRLVGSGSCVVRCDPACGSRVNDGAQITLSQAEPNDSTFGGAATLPDFTNFPLRDVVERTHLLGISLTIRGNGWVVRQEPVPGTPLTRVNRLAVWLSADSCRAFCRLMEDGM